jgi:hypothetical protein
MRMKRCRLIGSACIHGDSGLIGTRTAGLFDTFTCLHGSATPPFFFPDGSLRASDICLRPVIDDPLTPHVCISSVLAAFHYGSLTRPSQNPPRVGLLSTVEFDADKQLCEEERRAKVEHEGFASLSFYNYLLLLLFDALHLPALIPFSPV